MYWYRPKLVAILRSRDVLVKERQYILRPFIIILSGLGMPRNRSKNLPFLLLALSLLEKCSLLYDSSCFLTIPITFAIFQYQVLLKRVFIFLQVQLPVQRQTKHLRAAYWSYGLSLFQTLPRYRLSASSYSMKERIFVAETVFVFMAQFTVWMYFQCYFREVVAKIWIYLVVRMGPLALRSGMSTSYIFCLYRWMCGSCLMLSIMSPSSSRGSMGSPTGSDIAVYQLWHPPIQYAQYYLDVNCFILIFSDIQRVPLSQYNCS